jgi:hypothetical protein
MMTALSSANWCSTPEAALAASDQFRSVVRDSSKWRLNHHCLIPDLAVSFSRLLRSCSALAAVLQEEANNPKGVNWAILSREMVGFKTLLEQFMTMMSDYSNRIRSDSGQPS